MFDFVRRHTKLIMVVLFLLIVPSFVMFGIQGYTRMNEGGAKVATVGGHAITQAEWDAAHRQEVDRIRAANPAIDAGLLDSPSLKFATLERLVRERVLAAEADSAHLSTSDARLAAELQRDPAIAGLRRADGSLDMDRYRQLLAGQGLTPEAFEANVRRQMAEQQVLGGVAQSALVGAAQADAAMNALREQREVRVLRFTPAEFAAKIEPANADLRAAYTAQAARYQAPESARVEYVVLDLDAVKKAVRVDEAELRTYYEQNAATFGTPEKRRASHILIAAPKDAPAPEREKARQTAAALLAQVRAAPGTFADVARKSSQDETSAPAGGDLGFFERDKGIDPAIAKAAFALKQPGDIGDLVESDFGFHIVQLAQVQPAAVPPFEQLRPQLEEQYRAQQAQKRFGDMGEEFRNAVYEQSDTLKPIADKLGLPVQTADNVTRTPAPGASGELANPRFLNALFGADAVEKKRNTEAMDLGGNQLVSGRIVAHTPAHARPFDEVKGEVRAALVAERAAQAAREAGQARLKAWMAQPPAASALPAAITVSREAAHEQAPAVVEAALRADPGKLPTFAGVDLGADGYAVVRVERALPAAAQTPEQAAQARARYEQLSGMAELRSYYDVLKARHDARILVPSVPMALPAAAASR